MKSFTAATLLAALVSTVSAQASNGCDENYTGTFQISPYNVTDNIPSQALTVCTSNPIVSLKNGVLTDQDQRTGEVVANTQFQFDNPIQGPTTSGFSVCSNGSLALKGNAIWYGCLSGGFSNLYSTPIGGQCHQIYIVTYPCQGSGATPLGGGSSPAPSTSSSSSSSSSSTSSSSTSSTTSTSSTSSTPVAPPPTTSTSTTPVVPVPPPTTSTTITTAPFPVGNSTTPAPTASKATTTSSTSTPASTQAATFKGAASIVAVGGKIVAVVAAAAAFALF